MSKYIFTKAEIVGIFRSHPQRCVWCAEPLTFKTVTIDHILPESLLDNMVRFNEIKSDYCLPTDFNINGFENWAPSCSKCNSSKGDDIYSRSPVFIKLLADSAKYAPIAQKNALSFKNDSKTSLALTKIAQMIDEGLISSREIKELLTLFNTDVQQFILRVDTQWQLISKSGDMAVVSKGGLCGITPTGNNVHSSWQCPTCFNYGPWNGARCLSCGQFECD